MATFEHTQGRPADPARHALLRGRQGDPVVPSAADEDRAANTVEALPGVVFPHGLGASGLFPSDGPVRRRTDHPSTPSGVLPFGQDCRPPTPHRTACRKSKPLVAPAHRREVLAAYGPGRRLLHLPPARCSRARASPLDPGASIPIRARPCRQTTLRRRSRAPTRQRPSPPPHRRHSRSLNRAGPASTSCRDRVDRMRGRQRLSPVAIPKDWACGADRPLSRRSPAKALRSRLGRTRCRCRGRERMAPTFSG